MKKLLVYVTSLTLFLTIIMPLAAINHMEQILTITNDVPNSGFGQMMATLDFNGDGFDDAGLTYSITSLYLTFSILMDAEKK